MAKLYGRKIKRLYIGQGEDKPAQECLVLTEDEVVAFTAKVAREIFEEIEKEIDLNMSVIQKILNARGGRVNGKTVIISKYDVFIEAKKFIAELKKKYTEDI